MRAFTTLHLHQGLCEMAKRKKQEPAKDVDAALAVIDRYVAGQDREDCLRAVETACDKFIEECEGQ